MTVQVSLLRHASVAVRVKVWLRRQPFGTTGPGTQMGGMLPLHTSLAVMPRAATIAQDGRTVGLQRRSMGTVGQPVNTGLAVSTTQL